MSSDDVGLCRSSAIMDGNCCTNSTKPSVNTALLKFFSIAKKSMHLILNDGTDVTMFALWPKVDIDSIAHVITRTAYPPHVVAGGEGV